MLELYLIRHGQTEGNASKVFYGRTDYPLNAEGCLEAKNISHQLSKLSPIIIYSSPLTRAMQTAAIIAQNHTNIKIESCEELSEMNFGSWEGLTYTKISDCFPDDWEKWCLDWWDTCIPGGESSHQMYDRVTLCIDKIIEKHPDGQIIIISHHGCLRSIITHLLGFSKDGYWRFQIKPGSISRITIQDNFCVLNLLNTKEL